MFENRNEKQVVFNQIRGEIYEMNDGERFCSITLTVGHENTRYVNLVMKKAAFDEAASKFSMGDRVEIRFFLVSNYKHDRWYTSANVLSIRRA